MKSTEQKLKDLIELHVFYTCEIEINHNTPQLKQRDLIEQQYIVLSRGYEIRDNPTYKKLLTEKLELMNIKKDKS